MSDEMPHTRPLPTAAGDVSIPPLTPGSAVGSTTTPPIGARAKPRLGAGSLPPMASTRTVPPIPLPVASTSPSALTVSTVSAEGQKSAAPAIQENRPGNQGATVRAAAALLAFGILVFAGVAYVGFPKLIAQQTEWEEEQRRLAHALHATRDPEEIAAAARPRPKLLDFMPTAQESAVPLVDEKAPPVALAPSLDPVEALSSAEASVAFQAWVQNVKITGLRTGAMPRLLISGVSFDVGEVVHEELGIRFDGYDSERRMLRFRDTIGSTVERRHH